MKITRVTLDNKYADSVEMGIVADELSDEDKARLRKHIDDVEECPENITIRYEEEDTHSSVDELIDWHYYYNRQ